MMLLPVISAGWGRPRTFNMVGGDVGQNAALAQVHIAQARHQEGHGVGGVAR